MSPGRSRLAVRIVGLCLISFIGLRLRRLHLCRLRLLTRLHLCLQLLGRQHLRCDLRLCLALLRHLSLLHTVFGLRSCLCLRSRILRLGICRLRVLRLDKLPAICTAIPLAIRRLHRRFRGLLF